MKITLPFQRFMPLKHASILLVFFTFFSCEKEDSDLIENPANAEEIMIKTYNSKDFEFDTSLLDKLKETKSILSVREKSFYDSINHFYVDDSRFNHLKQGQYESYSFEIVDTEDSLYVKQLILATKLNEQNEIYYESYLAKFPKIHIESNLSSGDLITNKVEIVKLISTFSLNKELAYFATGDCLSVYEAHPVNVCEDPIDSRPQCGSYEGTFGTSSYTWVPNTYMEYTLLSTSCSSGGGGGSSGSGSSGSGYSGSGDTDGSSGSSGNFDPDGSTPFSPVETCPKSGGTSLTSPDGCTTDVDQYNREQLMLEEFYNSLGSAFLTWINDPQNIDFKLQLESFLKNNMRDSASFAFARAAVEAKSLNPRFTEVDFEDPFANMDLSVERELFQQGFRDRMSAAELVIFDEMPIGDQIDYLGSAFMAEQYMEYYYDNTGDYGFYNGIGDAFRHTYWNASATWKLGSEKVKELTDAHEDRVPNPDNPFEYKEVEMDLYNNQRGREIGNSTNFMLFQRVKWSIDNGLGVYLNNRNPLNNRATTDSQLIPTKK